MTTSTGYAEMFEWADGNPEAQDRAGHSVVFVGPFMNKIRIARGKEIPFGVVGGDNTSVDFISGASASEWHGKHKRDVVGRLKWQPQQMVEWTDKGYRHWYELDRVPAGIKVPPDALIHSTYPDGRPMIRQILTDEFINGGNQPDYTPRFERPEWAIVVIMGRVQMRLESPSHPNWIQLSRFKGTKPDNLTSGMYTTEWLIK